MEKFKKYVERFIAAIVVRPAIVWTFDAMLFVAPFVGAGMIQVISVSLAAFAISAAYHGVIYISYHWYDLPSTSNIDIDGDFNVVKTQSRFACITQTPRADDYCFV